MAEEEESNTATMPYILNVRGGVSKEGIVRKLPQELVDKSLDEAIKYATKKSELKDDHERSISDAIDQEISKGQYIIVLNDVDTIAAEMAAREVLGKYMQVMTKKLEDGTELRYGYAELAVSGVQEGGNYKSLESRM